MRRHKVCQCGSKWGSGQRLCNKCRGALSATARKSALVQQVAMIKSRTAPAAFEATTPEQCSCLPSGHEDH